VVVDWRKGFRAAKRADFEKPTLELARALIGAVLSHATAAGIVAGRIVETEAYLAEGDPASHSHRGRTARNTSMFGRPGTAYVYLSYGMHCCFNVVTGAEGVGEAVLVRALEPLEGLAAMHERRGGRCNDARLCSGPGNLTRALGIGLDQDGCALDRGSLRLFWPRQTLDPEALVSGPRVGITKAADLALRFVAADSPHASKGPRSGNAARRRRG